MLNLAGSRLGFKDQSIANERAAQFYLDAPPLQNRVDDLEARLRALTDEKRRLEESLARRDTEISAVSKLLHASELAEQRQKNDIDWLVSLSVLFLRRPAWWFMLIPPIQRKLFHKRILRKKSVLTLSVMFSRYPRRSKILDRILYSITFVMECGKGG
ncbi:hypothetical protein [Sphingobium sp. Ant17]|uniref:hypothetical protein n=1 Tax=Sphingobium sp. Ant17 TaxID=1461752 RepID=UPI001267C919|nr:hypothetical protein [Sphingobium sp. Ant17]